MGIQRYRVLADLGSCRPRQAVQPGSVQGSLCQHGVRTWADGTMTTGASRVSFFTLTSRVGPASLSSQSHEPPLLFSMLQPTWIGPCLSPNPMFSNWLDRAPVHSSPNVQILSMHLFNIFRGSHSSHFRDKDSKAQGY